jgi:hypothetical protein
MLLRRKGGHVLTRERPDELVTHNVVTPSGRYGTDDQPNVLSSNRRCQDFRPFQPLSCRHEIVDPVISPKQDGFLEDEGGHLPDFSIGTRAEPLPEGTRCCLSRGGAGRTDAEVGM